MSESRHEKNTNLTSGNCCGVWPIANRPQVDNLPHIGGLVIVLVFAIFTGGCSIKRIAVNKLGNALASGGSTFESDDDPDLVGASLPFALKLMESLLAESPRHTGLLLATVSGF